MSSNSILDSKLFIRLDLSPTTIANDLFQSDLANVAHLASQFLLYDVTIIPTSDFGIVPALVSWLGFDNFKSALETSAIRFLRRRGLLGYAGNGIGLSEFIVQAPDHIPVQWWQEALFGKAETAAYLQIMHSCPSITAAQRSTLIELITTNTHIVEFNNDSFMKDIVHESYTDIIQSEPLSSYLITHYKATNSPINLPSLAGVDSNQMRLMHQGGIINDPIDLVLRVAEVNLLLLVSSQLNGADVLAMDGAENLLKQKIIRAGINKTSLESFTSLLELNSICNIEPAIISGDISLSHIWDVRQKSVAQKFRKWLQTCGTYDAREMEKLYVRAIGRPSLTDSLPVKSLRFATTTVAGIVQPLAGLAAGVADSFIVDKLLSGYSPRLFFDEVSSLVHLR